MECDLENIKVNYDICGEGKPILFLHGWGFGYSHRDWLDTVEPFFKDMIGSNQVTIISMSLYGLLINHFPIKKLS
jgi:pimeloyl-ACP methyl ester carboxylesterase